MQSATNCHTSAKKKLQCCSLDCIGVAAGALPVATQCSSYCTGCCNTVQQLMHYLLHYVAAGTPEVNI